MCNYSFNCHLKISFEEAIRRTISLLNREPDSFVNEKNEILTKNQLYILETDALFRRLRKIWRQLEDIIITDKLPTNINKIYQRNEIIESLQTCVITLYQNRENISKTTQNKLTTNITFLRHSILPLGDLQEIELCKLTRDALDREDSPVFQYLHTYLSIQWFLVLIDYSLTSSNEHMQNVISLFLKDLMVLGKLQYNRADTRQKQQNNPFLCLCVKQAWIACQFFVEKILSSGEEFWKIFNDVMKECEPAFSLWLLYHVAMLQAVNEEGIPVGEMSNRIFPNHALVEEKLKNLCNSANDQVFLNCLAYVEPLVNNLWIEEAKITHYQILWEYFSKHLNTALNDDFIPRTVSTLIERRNNVHKIASTAKNAYELFAGMLVKHLRKHPTQWSKLKGRIYSRLPVQKIVSLNDWGLYKIIFLFMSLDFVDFEDLSTRIRNILENLPKDRLNTPLVWNLYAALVSFVCR